MAGMLNLIILDDALLVLDGRAVGIALLVIGIVFLVLAGVGEMAYLTDIAQVGLLMLILLVLVISFNISML